MVITVWQGLTLSTYVVPGLPDVAYCSHLDYILDYDSVSIAALLSYLYRLVLRTL
jgi:hypothetical protein